MLSYLWVCNRLVWSMEWSKTFCSLIAVLLTPFHLGTYLCMFSIQPKLFSCCSQPHSILSLSVTHTHTESQELKIVVLDVCNCYKRLLYCCMKLRDWLLWLVYKIPLVHSATGNRNSFPVIQDTHSHSIPDIMPLGSRCGKLWGGVFKGGAEAWACGTEHKRWTESGCLML